MAKRKRAIRALEICTWRSRRQDKRTVKENRRHGILRMSIFSLYGSGRWAGAFISVPRSRVVFAYSWWQTPTTGTLHTISIGENGHAGCVPTGNPVYCGNGKIFDFWDNSREPSRVAFDYFKAHASRVSGAIKPSDYDYICIWSSCKIPVRQKLWTLANFIALCSCNTGKSMQVRWSWWGDMSLGGTLHRRVTGESLQVALMPVRNVSCCRMSSVTDIPTVPGDCLKIPDQFFSDPVDAVFTALGVEWSSWMGCRNVGVKRNAACELSCFQERTYAIHVLLSGKLQLIALWRG